jgi:hypothetical protein
MRYAHDCGRVAEAVEHLTPRLSGLPGVVIRPHAELGVSSLDRRVDHVAGDQGVLARLADEHRVMVDSVTRGRNKLHRLVECKIARHDLRPLPAPGTPSPPRPPRSAPEMGSTLVSREALAGDVLPIHDPGHQ